MSTLRNKRLMLKVCELYYIQGKVRKKFLFFWEYQDHRYVD